MAGFISNEGPEAPSNEAVPVTIVLAVQLVLQVGSDLLVGVHLVQRVLSGIDDFLLELLRDVLNLDDWLHFVGFGCHSPARKLFKLYNIVVSSMMVEKKVRSHVSVEERCFDPGVQRVAATAVRAQRSCDLYFHPRTHTQASRKGEGLRTGEKATVELPDILQAGGTGAVRLEIVNTRISELFADG